MQRSLLLFCMVLFAGSVSVAQSDSVMYQTGAPLEDGIFITYSDFRSNRVIPSDNLFSNYDPEQLDFVSRCVEKEKITYRTEGKQETVNSKDIWGYVQNGTFYVNYQGKFYRIPVFGSISFLVAMVEVQHSGFYDPRTGFYSSSTTTLEQREFIMNFYDGKLKQMNQDEVENLLSRDKALYQEYQQLSSRRQSEQLYRFIRRYNENNPVYFLKN